MKKISYIVLISFIVALSCTPKKENNKVQTPAALEDGYSSGLKKTRGDLMENLYQELVERDSALKKLEEELTVFRSEFLEVIEVFHTYQDKSEDYYHSANIKAKGITDSLLMKKMQLLIADHQKAYKTRTAEINSLLNAIANNNVRLNDHHSALKIMKTLPVMEKYQKKNMLDKNGLKKLILQQEKMLKQIDDLMTNP